MERLQRILSARGVASRRKAEEMITAGRVSVDGQIVTELGVKADPVRSEIRVDGVQLKAQSPRYILLNKPRGYITTTKDERDRWTVMDLVEIKERVYPVGRLDRETEGLLLLTNDGDVANRVMHPRYELEKEYHVITTKRPSDTTMQHVRSGVRIDGKKVVPSEFRILRESREGLILTISIHEGINHVVRKIMETAKITVERLRRIRVGPLTLTGLPLGAWRDLTPGERATLFEAIGLGADKGRAPAERSIGEPRPEIHLTRRPARIRPLTSQEQTAKPRHQQRPAAAATTSVGVKPEPTEKAAPKDVRSRRRKGEPPAPLPKRPRTEHASRERTDSRTGEQKPPAKQHRPPRGEHDKRDRRGGSESGGTAKPTSPKGGRDRRSSSGGQNNSSKPRRRTPRRDAV
jgi:23S rRNA pseudouridine2605 synthase